MKYDIYSFVNLSCQKAFQSEYFFLKHTYSWPKTFCIILKVNNHKHTSNSDGYSECLLILLEMEFYENVIGNIND